MDQTRDYRTISDSAVALMLLKAQTRLPYAYEAAHLLFTPEEVEKSFNKADFGAWASVVHFENRYATINQLIIDSKIENLLELSSGFSFRGQALLQQGIIKHCIDTDLPEVIKAKERLSADLQIEIPAGSRLQMLPLNVVEQEQFKATVSHFDKGKLVIVTEGLLVYLSKAEKEQICKTIYSVLKERGGYWITSDIYLKHAFVQGPSQQTKAWETFFRQEGVQNHLFSDFLEAQIFFEDNGFTIEKVAAPAYESLSSTPYLLNVANEEQLNALRTGGQIQQTWRLACQ